MSALYKDDDDDYIIIIIIVIIIIIIIIIEEGSHAYIRALLLEPKGDTAVRRFLRRRGNYILLQNGQRVVNASMALSFTVT